MSGVSWPIEKVAVIGGHGRMGRLFLERCAGAGIQAVGLDQPLSDECLERGLAGADLCLLCVPITVFGEVVRTVAPHLGEGTILADIASVKVAPMAEMMKAYGGPVVGTHPLFGPTPGQDDSLRVAVAPGRQCGAVGGVIAWLARLGFTGFHCTAEEHDRAAAFVQGLNFVTSAAYCAATAEPSIARFMTPSLGRRLEAARKMLTEDAAMFEAMFEANPFGQEAVRVFRRYLNVAAGGDVGLLVDRAGIWWKPGGS